MREDIRKLVLLIITLAWFMCAGIAMADEWPTPEPPLPCACWIGKCAERGDVDGDGVIGPPDIKAIDQCIADFAADPTAPINPRCNTICDQAIDFKDKLPPIANQGQNCGDFPMLVLVEPPQPVTMTAESATKDKKDKKPKGGDAIVMVGDIVWGHDNTPISNIYGPLFPPPFPWDGKIMPGLCSRCMEPPQDYYNVEFCEWCNPTWPAGTFLRPEPWMQGYCAMTADTYPAVLAMYYHYYGMSVHNLPEGIGKLLDVSNPTAQPGEYAPDQWIDAHDLDYYQYWEQQRIQRSPRLPDGTIDPNTRFALSGAAKGWSCQYPEDCIQFPEIYAGCPYP